MGFNAVHRVTSNAVVHSLDRVARERKRKIQAILNCCCPKKVDRLAGLKKKRKTKIIAPRPNTSHSHVLNQDFPLRNVLVALPRPPLPAFTRRVGPVGRHFRLILLLLLLNSCLQKLSLLSFVPVQIFFSSSFFLSSVALLLSLSLRASSPFESKKEEKKNFTLSLPRFLRTRAKAIDFRSFLSIFSARNGSSKTYTGGSTGIRPG